MAAKTDRNAVIAAYRAGDLARAERGCRDLLKASPDDTAALQMLGAIAHRRRDWRDAVAWFAKAAALLPRDASVRFNHAEALREAGEAEAAIAELRAALALAPAHVPALVTLATLLGDRGKTDEALALLDRAAANAPDDARLFFARGRLRLRTGGDGALGDLAAAVRLRPELAPAHYYLGMAALRDGDLERADSALAEAHRLAPELGGALVERGKIAMLRRDAAAAEGLYRAALAQRPGDAEAHALLAEALLDLRRPDEAAAAVNQARRLSPSHEFARLIEARLARARGDAAAGRALLEPLLAATQSPQIAIDGAYELGRACDQLGDYPAAFDWFARANDRLAQSPAAQRVDRTALPQRVAAMSKMPLIADATATADRGRPPPAFIVGFPRSGTTLVEAILASHPAFVTSDEAPILGRVIREIGGPYPDAIAALGDADLARLRKSYWRAADEALPDLQPDRRLVDKQPWNLIELPLIARLFSNAPVVTVLRDPRDACLSCFQQYFGLNTGTVHFFTLADTAALYGQMMGLWRNWRDDPALHKHELRYEDLVDDFDAAVGALLAFLGVEWDDAVRRFAETAAGRQIRTPSRDAVTQTVHARARGRWRNYAEQMAEVLPALDPLVAAFGYD